MAIYKQDILDVNLNTGNIYRSFLPHAIGFSDNSADHFGVRCFRDGEPESLTGVSIQGYFRNSQGQNIALTSYGTVSGNVAYVTLPQACYAYEGQFTLALKLVGGGITGTVRIIDGMVDNTNTSSPVAPTSSVPTYQEVLALFEQASDMVDDFATLEKSVGMWYHEKDYASVQSPNFTFDTVFTKFYFKLLAPTSGVSHVSVFGSSDNWSSQTRIYQTYDTEFVAEIDPTGYTALKVAVTLTAQGSGTLRAIIHAFDDHTLAQQAYELDAGLKALDQKYAEKFQDVFVPGAAVTGTDHSGYYINSGKKIVSINNASYHVKAYPVEEGKVYYLSGSNVSLQAAYPLACFDTNAFAENLILSTTIISGSATATNYNEVYTAPDDGYLYVASYAGRGELIVYEGELPGEALIALEEDLEALNDRFGDFTVPSDMLSGTNYSGFYISNSNKFTGGQTSNYNVRSYPVEANKTYYIAGEGVRLNASLPLCGFGTTDVASGVAMDVKLLDGTNTKANYELRYTPKVNGYIFVAWITGVNELHVFDTVNVADIVSKEMYPRDIVIQLFGDSITDNQWGDKLTWANFIQKYLPEFNLTIYNDAVGGSGIGHGKSTSTPSHSEDEYNHVHDLVTDGTTLHTEADAVVILAGTNNWNSMSVGDMLSTGTSTLYGCLKGILQYISEHSAATVFVCTIPQRYNSTDQGRDTNQYGEPVNSNGVSLAEFCEPFRVVSAFYGMPCIPLNEALGWNRANISNFSEDGLHPNETGDNMLAAFICSYLRQHLRK